MIDAADDGPEVAIIRFFRVCPEGSHMLVYIKKTEEMEMKRQTRKMLIQDMNLKAGERFKVGRYIMVFAGNDGGKFDEIIPVRVWKKRQKG